MASVPEKDDQQWTRKFHGDREPSSFVPYVKGSQSDCKRGTSEGNVVYNGSYCVEFIDSAR